jgi:hypothetical protein
MISKIFGLMMLAIVVVGLLGATAQAQTVRDVPRGSGFTVENVNECAPNADVVVFYNELGAEPRQIGASLTDPVGHFSVDVTMPLSATLGAGSITVECGIEGGVLLYDVVIVDVASSDLFAYAPHVAGVIGVLALAVLLRARSPRHRQSDDSPADDQPPAPVEATVASGLEEEDDNEYWFWDTTTEQGPVKRLACLTEYDFYLHEVPADAFSPLLELLATVGPEAALTSAFFSVAIADIDEIRYRRTEMQVTYRSGEEFVTRTIDLATEVDGVMDLLSRRVPIMEAKAPVPSE